MKHHNYYVYILHCSDGSYYTGVTNDLDKRFQEHQEGIDEKCYTYKRRPLILKYYEHTRMIEDAIAREKQIKGWSRKKKEALMTGDIEELERLAERRSKRNEEINDLANNPTAAVYTITSPTVMVSYPHIVMVSLVIVRLTMTF